MVVLQQITILQLLVTTVVLKFNEENHIIMEINRLIK